MSDDFDPYHKWLGIPPAEQPPNHYRLLGIALFESDGDVIDAAAEQRMTYLQNIAQGPQLEHSQRLLNEISAARLCLLNAEKKARYDAEQRAAESAAPASADEPSADDFAFLSSPEPPPTVAFSPPPLPPEPDVPDFSGIMEAPVSDIPDFSGLANAAVTDVPDFGGLNVPTEPAAAIPQPPQPKSPPPPQVPDFSAVADTNVGEIPDFSAVASTPAAREFAIQTDAPATKPTTGPPKVPPAQADDGEAEPDGDSLIERITQLPTWALMAGGSTIAAILAVSLILLFRGPNLTKELRKANQAMLIIDWPTDEREGAYLEIDDEEKNIGSARELEFRLKAGEKHRIRIERDGYRSISQSVPFEKGQIKKLKLNWKRAGAD